MSWYVLNCRAGQEKKILHSCRSHISSTALESAFCFRSERLWRLNGAWRLEEKEMFPGYVFLQSSCPEQLYEELEQYRKILKVMEEPGYLISVYKDEEEKLRELCGEDHCLKMSYGYKEDRLNHITDGPLKGMESRILRIDWHRRFAQIEIPVARQRKIIWAGIAFDKEKAMNQDIFVS